MTAHVRPVLEAARKRGADVDALAADARFDLSGTPESISVETYLRLLNAAVTRLDDPFFGLEVGLQMRVTDPHAYALVLLACNDVRSLIEQVCRYESLAHDLFRTRLVVTGDVARLQIDSPWFDLPGGRQLVYMAASGIRAQSRWLLGADLPVFEFATRAPAPEETPGALERVLGASLRYGADFEGVSFPAMLLDLPIPTSDPSAFPALKRIADARLAARLDELNPDLPTRVRATLRDRMMRGEVTLAHVAAELKMGARTLQRKLAEAETSFSDLLDAVRCELVEQYLPDQQLSLTEVAFLLGFSDQSAFNHAFRAWFDMAPTEWRKRRGAKAP
jgi:AraC-like DNA-binding protein